MPHILTHGSPPLLESNNFENWQFLMKSHVRSASTELWRIIDEGYSPRDIGIPNGPAEDGTRGLLKAHDPKNKKIRKPKILLRKARVVIGVILCNLAGRVRNPPGLCKLVYHESLGSASYIRGSRGTKKGSNHCLSNPSFTSSSTFRLKPSRSTCPLHPTKP